jgi:hypothetical protein
MAPRLLRLPSGDVPSGVSNLGGGPHQQQRYSAVSSPGTTDPRSPPGYEARVSGDRCSRRQPAGARWARPCWSYSRGPIPGRGIPIIALRVKPLRTPSKPGTCSRDPPNGPLSPLPDDPLPLSLPVGRSRESPPVGPPRCTQEHDLSRDGRKVRTGGVPPPPYPPPGNDDTMGQTVVPGNVPGASFLLRTISSYHPRVLQPATRQRQSLVLPSGTGLQTPLWARLPLDHHPSKTGLTTHHGAKAPSVSTPR